MRRFGHRHSDGRPEGYGCRHALRLEDMQNKSMEIFLTPTVFNIQRSGWFCRVGAHAGYGNNDLSLMTLCDDTVNITTR